MILLEEVYCWVCGDRLFELAVWDPDSRCNTKPGPGVAAKVEEGLICVSHCIPAEGKQYYYVKMVDLHYESIAKFYDCGKNLLKELASLKGLQEA